MRSQHITINRRYNTEHACLTAAQRSTLYANIRAALLGRNWVMVQYSFYKKQVQDVGIAIEDIRQSFRDNPNVEVRPRLQDLSVMRLPQQFRLDRLWKWTCATAPSVTS